jgi:hypothetical protein
VEKVALMHRVALCLVDGLPRGWNRLASAFDFELRGGERHEKISIP